MVTPELLDFLRAQLATGMSPEQVERLLMQEGGWDKTDVEEGLLAIGHPSQMSKEVTPPLPLVPTTIVVTPEPVKEAVKEIVNEIIAPVVTAQESKPAVVLMVRSERDKASEDEDFLGILSGLPSVETKDKEKSTPPALVTPPPSVIIESTKPNLAEVSTSVSTPIPDVKEVVAEKGVLISTPLSPIVQPTPLQVAPTASPTASVIKFDLSQIRKVNEPAPTITPPLAIVDTPPISAMKVIEPSVVVMEPLVEKSNEKSIETRSVAELWLTKETGNTQAETQVAAASENEASRRSTLAARRTMGSDVLLRGKGATIQGLPALGVPEGITPISPLATSANQHGAPQPPFVMPSAAIQGIISDKKNINPSVAENILHKNKVKKVIGIALGGVIAVAFIVAGIMAYMSVRSPDVLALLSSVMSNFSTTPSILYSGALSSDLALTSTADGVTRMGIAKTDASYQGEMLLDANGFGDGNHHVRFSGGLQSGDFSWKTSIETDVRMFAENLYFHVVSFPSESNIDHELFKTYWIKVDLTEIAKELSGGATPAQNENYGNIAGGQSSSFVGILTKDMPFVGGEKIGSESISGISTTHFRLKSDPDKLALLVSHLYKKYTGKTYTLDDEGSVRFKNALMKLSIDVWVNESTKTLVQVSISGNLDDDMFGVHVKGSLALSFTLTGYGSRVIVTTPAPSLSLTELRTRMDDYKKIKSVRAQNLSRVNRLTDITHALTSYMNEKGKLPLTLTELSMSNLLASSTFASVPLKSYFYVAYVKANDFTKANKCTAKSKLCTAYHIGVDLDDVTDPALLNDADVTSEIHGDDSTGCAGGAKLSCYDVVYPERSATSTTP